METSPSPTHSPSTDEIVAKVCRVLADARQAPSPTALYLVFTDDFPEQSGFCAWHDGGKCPDGRRIHVAYLPNVPGAPQCDPGDLFHCNGLSAPTRALANVTAHELMEMLTDPDGDAWVDRSGRGDRRPVQLEIRRLRHPREHPVAAPEGVVQRGPRLRPGEERRGAGGRRALTPRAG